MKEKDAQIDDRIALIFMAIVWLVSIGGGVVVGFALGSVPH